MAKEDLNTQVRGLIADAVRDENKSLHSELKEISTKVEDIQKTLFAVPSIIEDVLNVTKTVYGGTKPDEGLFMRVKEIERALQKSTNKGTDLINRFVYPAITSLSVAIILGIAAILTGHLQWR